MLSQEDEAIRGARCLFSPEEVFHHARVKHGARLSSLARTNHVLDSRALFKQQSRSAARIQYDSPRAVLRNALATDHTLRSSALADDAACSRGYHRQQQQLSHNSHQQGNGSSGDRATIGRRVSGCSVGDEDEESAAAADPAAVLLKQATGCVAEMLYQLRRSTTEEAASAGVAAAAAAADAAATPPGLVVTTGVISRACSLAMGQGNRGCAADDAADAGADACVDTGACVDTTPLAEEGVSPVGGSSRNGNLLAAAHQVSWGALHMRGAAAEAEEEREAEEADAEAEGVSACNTSVSSSSLAAAMGVTFPRSPCGCRSIGGRGACSSRFVVTLMPSRSSGSFGLACGGEDSAAAAAAASIDDCSGRWCGAGSPLHSPSPALETASTAATAVAGHWHRHAARWRRASLQDYSGGGLWFVQEPLSPPCRGGETTAGTRLGPSGARLESSGGGGGGDIIDGGGGRGRGGGGTGSGRGSLRRLASSHSGGVSSSGDDRTCWRCERELRALRGRPSVAGGAGLAEGPGGENGGGDVTSGAVAEQRKDTVGGGGGRSGSRSPAGTAAAVAVPPLQLHLVRPRSSAPAPAPAPAPVPEGCSQQPTDVAAAPAAAQLPRPLEHAPAQRQQHVAEQPQPRLAPPAALTRTLPVPAPVPAPAAVLWEADARHNHGPRPLLTSGPAPHAPTSAALAATFDATTAGAAPLHRTATRCAAAAGSAAPHGTKGPGAAHAAHAAFVSAQSKGLLHPSPVPTASSPSASPLHPSPAPTASSPSAPPLHAALRAARPGAVLATLMAAPAAGVPVAVCRLTGATGRGSRDEAPPSRPPLLQPHHAAHVMPRGRQQPQPQHAKHGTATAVGWTSCCRQPSSRPLAPAWGKRELEVEEAGDPSAAAVDQASLCAWSSTDPAAGAAGLDEEVQNDDGSPQLGAGRGVGSNSISSSSSSPQPLCSTTSTPLASPQLHLSYHTAHNPGHNQQQQRQAASSPLSTSLACTAGRGGSGSTPQLGLLMEGAYGDIEHEQVLHITKLPQPLYEAGWPWPRCMRRPSAARPGWRLSPTPHVSVSVPASPTTVTATGAAGATAASSAACGDATGSSYGGS